MSNSSCVVSNMYLPSVEFFRELSHHQHIQIDCSDRYHKQTYRNRCNVIGANGLQTLTVPVVSGHSMGMSYRDMKIAYDTRWQQVHWRSIEAAYKSSPFFEYYQDDFVGFYEKQYPFLFDYNVELFSLILGLIGFSVEKVVTLVSEPLDFNEDLRFMANCKQPKDDGMTQPIYWQVFNQRFPFVPNLSIIDLLFNMGNESYLYLEEWGSRAK